MSATPIPAQPTAGRPTRISRNRTVSTKLTELDFSEAERTAAARGQWLSEWVRDVIVREVRAESEERIAEHAFTELVGVQLLLMNVLQPLLAGHKVGPEEFQKLLEQIQGSKQAKARELLNRRTAREEKSNVQHL